MNQHTRAQTHTHTHTLVGIDFKRETILICNLRPGPHSPTSKGKPWRGSLRNGNPSRRRVLAYRPWQRWNPERNTLLTQQNNLQSGVKSVGEKAEFGRGARGPHFCHACSAASDKHECIPAALSPERALQAAAGLSKHK